MHIAVGLDLPNTVFLTDAAPRFLNLPATETITCDWPIGDGITAVLFSDSNPGESLTVKIDSISPASSAFILEAYPTSGENKSSFFGHLKKVNELCKEGFAFFSLISHLSHLSLSCVYLSWQLWAHCCLAVSAASLCHLSANEVL